MEALRVGPAGWSYADWEGVVYPRPHPRGFHALAFLAGFFDCVELNSSFYAHPRADHARRWRELVEDRPRFRFLAKLGSVFTHGPRLDERSFENERAAYLAGIEPIADRLAAILIQFPVSFRDKPPARRRLDRIRAGFGHFPLVLELRQRSWFEPRTLAWLERSGFSLAAIDLPAADDHPPADAPTFGPIGYLRLHGRNAAAWFDRTANRDQKYDYLYGAQEIESLAERARRIARTSEQTFVVTNNHFTGKAVANALDILHALLGERPKAPPTLVERFPYLRTVSRTEGQQSLFD
jgi:uncharacterized protein YecE (DUF72 family)